MPSFMNLEKTRGTWIPPLSLQPTRITTEGYYDVLKRENPNPDDEPPRADTINSEIIRVKTIRILPDDDQKIILRKWMLYFAKMYNYTNTYIKETMMAQDCPGGTQEQVEKFLNFQTIRDILHDKKMLCKKDGIASHILDEAVHQCVTAYKSCCTNYYNENIWHFNIRNWLPHKAKQIMCVETQCFSTEVSAFCVRSLGEMKCEKDKTLLGINSTSILVFDREFGSWTFMVPQKIVGKQAVAATAKNQCGIDPGARTAFTVYSPNKAYEIHPKINFKKVFKKQDHLRLCLKVGLLNRHQFNKALKKRNRKMRNRITDMHWKVGKFLCERFDRIVIGKLNVRSVISNENHIGSYTKRVLLALSHYKFRQRLIEQGEKYGSIVIETSEYKTTMTCSECHHEQDVGSLEVYDCGGCGKRMGRDDNAARNMYGKE